LLKFHNSLTTDTIPVINKADSNRTDTVPSPSVTSRATAAPRTQRASADTIVVPSNDTFTFKTSDQALNGPVNYHADDSMVMDVPAKKLYLYGKTSNVKYLDNELTAPEIEYDQRTSLLKAVLKKDSSGNVIAMPSMKQAESQMSSDEIVYNLKTAKGITKGTYTQQGEMYIYGEKIKKVSPDVFYALRARFTTCNLDTPHFAFVSNKIKFQNQKMAYSGPVHPEFEGVPLPIFLPFGIYPLTQGRHSGLIAPAFTANEQFGLALEGLGYYKVLSDRWDVVARGTIYSYGGWNANISPKYYKRYRYQGNFTLAMQNFKTNFKGDPDYRSDKTYNIVWSHNADNKARPGVSFGANVNITSSKYNEQVPNNPVRNFTNQLSSHITYAKTWKDKPFNLSIGASHNQNTVERLFNVNLPDLSFSVNTQYPFRRQEPIGDLRWYENIGVALNTTARSFTSFYDTAGMIGKQMARNYKWGALHSVPISLSLPQVGPLQISPGITYQEKWFQEKFITQWDPANKKLDTVANRGFYTAREMSFSLGVSTRIFGMYTFNKSSRIQALRHEIRPSIAATYKPDMNKRNMYLTQVDTLGTLNSFNYFQRGIFGAFAPGRFGGLNFSIDNVLSMKVKDKTDTSAAALKKVNILDGFSLTGNYNFLADSFRLSNLSLSARSNLFNKINITAGATLDPYLSDSNGRPVDKLVWSKKALTLGRITSGSVAVQSSFRGGDKTTAANTSPLNNNNYPDNLDGSGLPLDEYQQEAAYIRNNPGEFADFSIPWSIDFSYSLRFYRQRSLDNTKFETKFFQDVNWNASINLTPKWKIGVNGSYNITEKKIGLISMYLTREMHCWQMAINISPVGTFRFFNITISPKSSILRDLRVNRTRYFYDL
jgi:hypothetical protein